MVQNAPRQVVVEDAEEGGVVAVEEEEDAVGEVVDKKHAYLVSTNNVHCTKTNRPMNICRGRTNYPNRNRFWVEQQTLNDNTAIHIETVGRCVA
mmetsp:Transcript_10170/g.14274  ORF Transcript_10170/g.14274 Transcript_10170/m.14274 type:complete len:94 (+) Transcript_10170:358-639(+)